MNLHLRYNLDKMCRAVLTEQLDKLGFRYSLTDSACVYFYDHVPDEDYVKLHEALQQYGIEILDNKKAVMVQKVKAIIGGMLDNSNAPLMKVSAHLSNELGENYRTIAQIFSETCHMTIENFIIMCKIERAKQLLIAEALSLTEISYKLNYSSVAHLSNQFKKITGLTPSSFQKIAVSRRHFKTTMLN
ncbi:helix-turn-helix domain-containing protein [Flavobacterium sp.]|uniref:helix-turn-helix domain-containing protein n=1 Tax=Flavobacterium sp. TaxID=239 RepID=UPI004033F226